MAILSFGVPGVVRFVLVDGSPIDLSRYRLALGLGPPADHARGARNDPISALS
jgi:hypothetical protein